MGVVGMDALIKKLLELTCVYNYRFFFPYCTGT